MAAHLATYSRPPGQVRVWPPPAGVLTFPLQAGNTGLRCGLQVRMATFSQHHVDGLDLALTPLQAMMRMFPGVKDEPCR